VTVYFYDLVHIFKQPFLLLTIEESYCREAEVSCSVDDIQWVYVFVRFNIQKGSKYVIYTSRDKKIF